MLRMFAIVSHVFMCFFSSVSDACFKCSIGLRTYVANVASECFKSRLGVASSSSLFDALHHSQTAEGA